MLPKRLTRIDETNIGDHSFLTTDDRCFYFGEYFGGTGYQGGPTNQLIINYKIKPSVALADSRRAYYKGRAIQTISAVVRAVISPRDAHRYTWVPIPTSKVVGHQDHDDRLPRTLNRAFRNYESDVRLLLRQTKSTQADHESDNRLSFDELLGILEVNPDCNVQPQPERIAVFDDLLTSGKHFKCCQRRLRELYPDVPIVGVFAARRILPNPFDDLS